MYNDLLHGLSSITLRFTVRAKQRIVLSGQPGSAIRGALYGVLSDNFCTEQGSPSDDVHIQTCPVCWLLADKDATARGGGDVPRAMTIQPPPPKTYHPGQVFRFGVTLIGNAQNLLPYVTRAAQKMGEVGIGQGRGRFDLISIHEYSPVYDVERILFEHGIVQKPTLQMTTTRVNEVASQMGGCIVIELKTPLRLIQNKQLVKKPMPVPFMARLADRVEKLAKRYAETDQSPSDDTWREAYMATKSLADTLQVVSDDTYWQDAFSGSKRTGRTTPIGGLMGQFCLEGDLSNFAALLIWGQVLHVGKDAVKGNGWYQLHGNH